jgi:small nuclear ribonucleoprotein (snRNP)-like protein
LKKYINHEVQIVLNDGKKVKATLLGFSNSELKLRITEKRKEEGKKTKRTVTEEKSINREDIKTVMAVISFK